jgi:hypothetical protein
MSVLNESTRIVHFYCLNNLIYSSNMSIFAYKILYLLFKNT